LRELCRLLGYSRQAYYSHLKASEHRTFKEEQLCQQVQYHRRLQPRIGARKLLVLLKPFMQSHCCRIGRDAFFDLLRWQGMLTRKRRNGAKTTFSLHRFKKYPDLAKGLIVNRPNQLWVSDITYLRINNGFAYLSLITDAYSRKIIGFCVSHDLSSHSCIIALQMALRSSGRPGELPLMHHSDRGTQYCSHEYTELLQQHHISISMTQDGNPRDNAIAERVNGILKQELLQEQYAGVSSARQAVREAVATYNHLRPHSSIDMLTPQQAHCKSGQIKRRWKSYYKKAAKEVIMDG
jgi:putative transposase